ncbi:hypothetical protein [Thermocatellispora tengchongensis]|uniref:hypothetical protein n=1 Tax=Thermocatellispora tengchongensis TaxID=1073253 RepID=UPI003635E26E
MTRVWRVVACVGLLAVIAVVQRVAPGPAEQYAPITTAGGLGSQVRTEEFVVRAERVAFARAVQFKDELGFVGEPMTTPGVWMVVWATAAATSEALRLQGVEVETAEGRCTPPVTRSARWTRWSFSRACRCTGRCCSRCRRRPWRA